MAIEQFALERANLRVGIIIGVTPLLRTRFMVICRYRFRQKGGGGGTSGSDRASCVCVRLRFFASPK